MTPSPGEVPFEEALLQRLQRRKRRDRALAARLARGVRDDLPVDGDAFEGRPRMHTTASVMDGLVAALLKEPSPFFDRVRAEWRTLAPGVGAWPGRFQDGKLFLFVKSSAAIFAVRPKLPALRRKLLALPGAPKKLTLLFEHHVA